MNYAIIGNSAAGIACVEAIRTKDSKSAITLVSEEGYHIYSRCLLSYFLAGDIKEDKLVYRPDDFYKTSGVEAVLGSRCDKVVPEKRILKIKGKDDIKFDRLLIASGAKPNFPDIDGIGKTGVFGLRTIEDARSILKALKDVKTVAILGGGLIGLKAAYGLSAHKKDIRVIVKSSEVLSQILDKKAGAVFQGRITQNGIRVMTGLEAKEILGKGKVEGIGLDNGETLDCQMVIVGKGVGPNKDIVKDTAIKADDGILVDDFLRTNIDCIYAAGDVAQAKDMIVGARRINAVWPVAVEEGKIAGLNMAGENVPYDGSMAMNSVEFFGLPAISMGITKPGNGMQELIYEDAAKDVYRKIVLKGSLIVGMVFVNSIRSAGVVRCLMRNRIDIGSLKETILEDSFDFAKVAALVKENSDKFTAEEFKEIMRTY